LLSERRQVTFGGVPSTNAVSGANTALRRLSVGRFAEPAFFDEW
jgi:hypothetical protein